MSSHQRNAAVCGLNDNIFMVVYESNGQDGSTFIYGQRFHGSGKVAGYEFRVNTYTLLDQTSPAIAPLSNGGYVVTWTSDAQDGSGKGVFAQRFDSMDYFISEELQVNTYTTNDQELSVIASLPNLGFVVIWQSFGQDGSGYGVYGQCYDGKVNTMGSEFQVNAYTANDQQHAAVASLGKNGFVVVWESDGQGGSGFGIYSQRFTSQCQKAGEEIRVYPYSSYEQRCPHVASVGDDTYIISWTSYEEGYYSSRTVAAVRFSIDGDFRTEFSIPDSTRFNKDNIVFASTSAGMVAVWEENVNVYSIDKNIEARRFVNPDAAAFRDDDKDDTSDMSMAIMIYIVVGAVIGLLIVAVAVWLCCKGKQEPQETPTVPVVPAEPVGSTLDKRHYAAAELVNISVPI